MNKFEKDLKKLNKINRQKYMQVYNYLGSKMFSTCQIPNVGDLADIVVKQDEDAIKKVTNITDFTGNYDEIKESLDRVSDDYSEEDSNKFMKKVIASNITDITVSGFFYKKLMASCDDMIINHKKSDCGSIGEEYKVKDITEDIYNYKVKFLYITEIDTYTETYEEFKEKVKDLDIIHIRNFLTCECSENHRTFCKKCAGIYKHSHTLTFIPKYIGAFSTLQITEHATQDSLDSMNNGTSESLNVLLEQNMSKEKFENYEDIKKRINQIIDEIGNIGVQARYYQIALLSRFLKKGNKWKCVSLVSRFNYRDDSLGILIYQPTYKHFKSLLSKKETYATSLKSRIMFDAYE